MPRFHYLRILAALLCSMSSLPSQAQTSSTGTPNAVPVSANSPAAKNADSGVPPQSLQAWLRNTADTATKLFNATEDLKNRTDNRRMFPGGPAEKKAPYLRSQVEDLEKQRTALGVEIERLGTFRTHHESEWKADDENLFLEIQISERSIGESLAVLRERLKEQHRWYLLGH